MSGGPQYPTEWRLLQCIHVQEVDPQPQRSQYDSLHIVGDEEASRLFALEGQPDFSSLLRQFQFATAKPILAEGKLIGQSIQSPRELIEEDVVLIEKHAKRFKTVPSS